LETFRWEKEGRRGNGRLRLQLGRQGGKGKTKMLWEEKRDKGGGICRKGDKE